MPMKFGHIQDDAKAQFKIHGAPDLETGNVSDRASLIVEIDAGQGRAPISMTRLQLFISYRRADTSGFAGRLRDGLRDCLPSADTFMDVHSLEAGALFREGIKSELLHADAALILIGKRWLEPANVGGVPRLFTSGDMVRSEVAAALSSTARVVPLLVQGASLPDPNDLPVDLQAICDRQAFELSEIHWQQDVERLARTLARQ